MQRKRLEEALNAGKLISLGFKINNSRPERLNLLYYVNCQKHNVIYANGETKTNESETQIKNSENSTSYAKKVNNKDDNLEHIDDDGYDNADDEKIEILSLQFNQNLNLLSTGDSNGHIQIYDIFSGEPIKDVKDELAMSTESISSINKLKASVETKYPISLLYNMPVICMKWHPNTNNSLNLLYFAHVNGYIGALDKDSMKKFITIEENDEISCIDFNKDGSCLVSVGRDYCIKLYDSNLNSSSHNKLIKSYGCHNINLNNEELLADGLSNLSISHTNRLQSAKFSDQSNDILFTGGWDRTVKIWDKRTQNGLVNTIHGPFICGSDAIDVRNNLILTASWVKENSLQLWDIRNCQRKLAQLPVISENESSKDFDTLSIASDDDLDIVTNDETPIDKRQNGEYLYACKFFASNSDHNSFLENRHLKDKAIYNPDCYSTVIACGSGTRSVHLIDYERSNEKRHIAAINCKSPLYCLDTIYSSSLIAVGSMKKFFTLMTT